MNSLLKKDIAFIWDDNSLRYFKYIKDAITKAPVLFSTNYSYDFIIFSFASQDIIVGVLLQNNVNDHEQPIDFMSKSIRDSKLNYSITKKREYALVKSLKHFRIYVRYNKIKIYVTYVENKDVLSQQDCLGTRGKWVSKIQKYDLEIKPTNIIKGQCLA